MIDLILPQKAATVQVLGHPSAGIIGWMSNENNNSGVVVTEDIALTYSAVWCATRVISETLATLPCILYRRTSQDGKERAKDDPRYRLVHDEPNRDMTAYSFFESGTQHLVNWGNAYARIVRAGDNFPQQISLRTPDTVAIHQDDTGMIEYRVSWPTELIEAPEMLHVTGLGFDGIQGYPVIRKAAQTIGAGMAAERYSAGFFGHGATPNGALVHPAKLSKEAREHYRREWNEIHQGPDRAGKLAILHGGMDYKQLGMSNEDAQFLESRKFSVTEIARWYRLPPHMLMDLERATFSNIEAQAIEFVVYSLQPWLRRWETTLNRRLLRDQERVGMFFEFLVESLLRGDTAARYAAYATSRQWGWASVNDIRRRENENPIEGGDVYLQPANMVPAGTVPEVPESIGQELRANLSESLTQIVTAARDLRVNGNHKAADASVEESLRHLRSDRQAIREDLANLGTTLQFRVGFETLRAAARELIAYELQRSLEYEAAAARKAAKAQASRGESFTEWIETFYPTRAGRLTEALRRPVKALGETSSRGCSELLRECVAEHVEESTLALLGAADGAREGFVDRVNAVCDEWLVVRADKQAERISHAISDTTCT